jgi:peptide/nickel transport system permease protein
MAGVVVRRLGFSVVALLLVSFVLMALTQAIPESPARVVLGTDATIEQIRNFEHLHGLDRPVIEQYLSWLHELVVHGSLGTSLVTGLSMNQRVVATLPVTLELVVVAFCFAVLLSLALGMASALNEDTWIDHAARVFSVVGVSVPGFWLALVLIIALAVDMDWFPPGGISPVSDGLWDHLQSLALPGFCLGIFYTAILSRMTRSSLLEVLGADYIRTARATGLTRRLILVYAMRNALVPVVTVAAMSFGYMFGWALIIETVFNIPGMSASLLIGINQRDFAMVRAVVFVLTLVFLLSNLLADLLNAWLNPRLRQVRG